MKGKPQGVAKSGLAFHSTGDLQVFDGFADMRIHSSALRSLGRLLKASTRKMRNDASRHTKVSRKGTVDGGGRGEMRRFKARSQNSVLRFAHRDLLSPNPDLVRSHFLHLPENYCIATGKMFLLSMATHGSGSNNGDEFYFTRSIGQFDLNIDQTETVCFSTTGLFTAKPFHVFGKFGLAQDFWIPDRAKIAANIYARLNVL
eukprot:scaffold13335_cov149-Amphora_coffeaeformis.AAC.3